jgi:hypothetical protein
MKNEPNEFSEINDKWDFQELPTGHEMRFLTKLDSEKSKNRNNLYRLIGIAAVFVVGFIIFQTWNKPAVIQNQNNALLSKQSMETTQYFEYLIASELEKLNEHNDSLSQEVISEALIELEKLEADYKKIELELKKNGETKQLIHAMILNFQTRISFLENVLNQIELIKNQKINQDENNLL